jgi:hypothetical protein
MKQAAALSGPACASAIPSVDKVQIVGVDERDSHWDGVARYRVYLHGSGQSDT